MDDASSSAGAGRKQRNNNSAIGAAETVLEDMSDEAILRGLRARQQSVNLELHQLQQENSSQRMMNSSSTADRAASQQSGMSPPPSSTTRQQIRSLTDAELEMELRQSEMQLQLLRREQHLQEELYLRQNPQQQQQLLSAADRFTGSGQANAQELLLLRRLQEEQQLEQQLLRQRRQQHRTAWNEPSFRGLSDRDEQLLGSSSSRYLGGAGDSMLSGRHTGLAGSSLADLLEQRAYDAQLSASLPGRNLSPLLEASATGIGPTSALHDADRALLRQLQAQRLRSIDQQDALQSRGRLAAANSDFLPEAPSTKKRSRSKSSKKSFQKDSVSSSSSEDADWDDPPFRRRRHRSSDMRRRRANDPPSPATGPPPNVAQHRQGWVHPMALASDKGKLTVVQVLIRESLQYFQASADDAVTSVQGRKQKIRLGQVGVRCRYCSHVPIGQRSKGAVHYPKTLLSVYQAAQNIASGHLSEPTTKESVRDKEATQNCCRWLPDSVRDELEVQRPRRDASNVGKSYWVDACKDLGIVEQDGALWLDVSMDVDPPPPGEEKQSATSKTATGTEEKSTGDANSIAEAMDSSTNSAAPNATESAVAASEKYQPKKEEGSNAEKESDGGNDQGVKDTDDLPAREKDGNAEKDGYADDSSPAQKPSGTNKKTSSETAAHQETKSDSNSSGATVEDEKASSEDSEASLREKGRASDCT